MLRLRRFAGSPGRPAPSLMPEAVFQSPSAGSLPQEIVQSIAIANASVIGTQPAVLANLALANQIFNQNLQQQMAISTQQAINQVTMAAVAKCVALLARDNGAADPAALAEVKDLIVSLKSLPTVGVPIAPPAA